MRLIPMLLVLWFLLQRAENASDTDQLSNQPASARCNHAMIRRRPSVNPTAARLISFRPFKLISPCCGAVRVTGSPFSEMLHCQSTRLWSYSIMNIYIRTIASCFWSLRTVHIHHRCEQPGHLRFHSAWLHLAKQGRVRRMVALGGMQVPSM